MGKPCAVPNCNKNTKILNLKRSVFKVPTDETLRKKWQAAIPSLKANQFVCDRHFVDSCIVRRYVRYDSNGRLLADIAYQKPHLTPDAVPTILITPDEFERSVLQKSASSNELSTKLDSLQERQVVSVGGRMERETTIAVTSSQQEQDSNLKIEKANQSTHKPTMDLQQPVATMTRELTVVGTNNKSKIENDDATVPEEAFEEGVVSTAETAKDSLAVTNSDESNSDFVESNILKAKSLQASRVVPKIRVSFTCSISDENAVVQLPATWSISQTSSKLGTEIILCQMRIQTDNDTKNLIVKRYIVIEDWSGGMQYYVYGKKVNTDGELLPKVLTDVSTLPAVLAKFERMRVCKGLGPVSSSFMKNEAFKDYSDSWHHKDCSLITKKNKCESCKKFKRTLWQREHRYAKKATTKDLSRIVDAQKVKILKRKLQTQKRLRNRAMSQLKVLRYRWQLKHEEIVNLTMESIEEKCRKLNVSDQHTLAIKEILAAAKTTKSGRRYSEDWLLQCMLMNMRSPSQYQLLQSNDIIPLPCTRTIRKYYTLIDSMRGLDGKFAKLINKQLSAKKTI